MESSEQTTKGFSFGFSKVKSSKKISEAALKDDDKDEIIDRDYVTSLEDKTVKSLRPVEESKPLVIPLIEKNRWRVPKPEDLEKPDSKSAENNKSEIKVTSTGDEITDKAVAEILSEARREQEVWETRGDADPNRAIPLLLRNKIPDGFETDDKLDVALRPDEAAEADYQQVPIEEYGMAMLRGMGFKEEEGIGKNKKLVAPVEAVARPKGLGLGADRSLTLQQKNDNKSGAKNSGEEQLCMKKGSYCVVKAGRHQGLYAMIQGIDEDNARVVIELKLGGNVITLNQMAIQLVSKKEFEKYSKYLNKSKFDRYKAGEEKKQNSEASGSEQDDKSKSNTKHHKHKKDKHNYGDEHGHHSHESKKHKSSRDRDKHEYGNGHHSEDSVKYSDYDRKSPSDQYVKHKKHRSRSPIKEDKTHRHKEKTRPSLWLHPFLKVRMVDPEFKKGRYYKSKLVIEDVAGLDSCMCRTEDGKILEGLSQSQLETVIPKSQFSCVMVVSGQHKGQIGEILDWDKSTNTASVQLLQDKDEILTLDYDTICEYTGSIQNL